MDYFVSDFYEYFKQDVRIIAGSNGLNNKIVGAGILDYEIDDELKDQYLHTNFQEHQLIVTTFLCAKNNPFIIIEAIKHLISKGVSCLVIKNVFHLPIQEIALRYANSKNFPIFLLESKECYVETILYEVFQHCKLYKRHTFLEEMIDKILYQDISQEDIVDCLKEINPSMKEQFFNICIRFENYLSKDSYDLYYNRFLNSDLNLPGNRLIIRKNSLFYTHCESSITQKYSDELISHILKVLLPSDAPYLSCGVSHYHLTKKEYKVALYESLYATSGNFSKERSYIKYNDLGSYQIIFPFANAPEMQHYANRILQMIENYDLENNANLMYTLYTYFSNDTNLENTAHALQQHKNTIRYRLDKIKSLTGLNYKCFTDLEQLSLALKIHQCSKETFDS